MFNLLVQGGGWNETGVDSIPLDRVFEYTAPFIAGKYRKNDDLRVNDLQELPTVLMSETSTTFGDDQLARIATLTDISVTGKRVDITYVFDPNFPPIPNATIEKKLRTQWDLTGWATSRNHWAIKDVDLFRSLLPIYLARRYHPRVFDLPEDDMVNDNLVSVMMPMDARLNPVYSTICEVAAEFEMDCKRADDIWESHAIMEDVVSLIFRSRIVIVDCSGDNPNGLFAFEVGVRSVRVPRLNARDPPESALRGSRITGGSLWSTTLRACVSCWWDWAMWRCSVSATRAAGRCGCMCVAGRRGRRVGAVGGRCGPTVSGRWCWWTSRRSVGQRGWCGTSAGGAARGGAVGRALSLRRPARSRRRGRC